MTPAPNPRFQIAALKFADALLEITWQDSHCSRYPEIVTDMAVSLAPHTDEPEKRHIRSCHVDLDEFYSRLRILYAKHQDPRRWTTFRKD